MKLSQPFKKDYIIGLDIGTSSIKMAKFIRKEDGLHLIKAGLEEIAHAKDEASGEKEILTAFKRLLQGIDIKRSKFIVAINCPKTCMRKVTAPYMPKGELHEGIRLEAKNYFPFSIDDALLDFQILGDIVEEGVKKYQIAVATSPQKTIDKFLSILGKLGIKPASFIPLSYALHNLYEVTHSKEEGLNCFLDIGQQNTEFVIFKGRNLIFCRKMPVTGSDFTKSMTEVLLSDRGRTELSLDEAEEIKREVGLPSEGESKMIKDKISTTQILSMLRSPLEQLVNEINRSFDYYREETRGGTIDSLVLFGGGASLKGLGEFLSKELGIEVKLGSSLEGLKIESGAIRESRNAHSFGLHQLAVAIGAALSEGKGINLLPPEVKEETRRTFKRATVQAIAVAAILILSFVYIGMRIRLANFQKRISVARLELSSLGSQAVKVKTQNLVNNILADEPYWEDVLKELSNIIPMDIYLTELSMKNKTIKMKGVITLEEGEGVLSDFILALEKGIFRNVKLVTTKDLKEKAATAFEIGCWVD